MTTRFSRFVAPSLAGLLAALVLLVVPFAVGVAQEGPSLVILVRHAEKAAVPGNDPPISEAGEARAKALAAALVHTPISAVITSTLKRTSLTAAHVAEDRKLVIESVGMTGGTPAHVEAVAAAVRAKRGVVLVVGHSNTIPAIIGALGGPKLPDICDASYATMYVLRPVANGPAPLVVSQYGASDPEGATSCAGMTPR